MTEEQNVVLQIVIITIEKLKFSYSLKLVTFFLNFLVQY